MSFYETSNNNIIRFAVHNPAKKVIAPFSNLKRVCAFSSIGAGTSAYYTGTNTSWCLTPELLQNGSIIISPASSENHYTLPSAYALQEYLSGRGAFNFDSNNTGANDFFVVSVYNLKTQSAVVHAYDNASAKTIPAALANNDANVTPVLIQFVDATSSYATVNGSANPVSYTVY